MGVWPDRCKHQHIILSLSSNTHTIEKIDEREKATNIHNNLLTFTIRSH